MDIALSDDPVSKVEVLGLLSPSPQASTDIVTTFASAAEHFAPGSGTWEAAQMQAAVASASTTGDLTASDQSTTVNGVTVRFQAIPKSASSGLGELDLTVLPA